MPYNKTNWLNDQSPALEADNLNKMEQGIYDADVKAEQAKAGNPSAANTQKLANITVSNPIDLDTSVLNTGATMTGHLKGITPVDDADFATMGYVNSLIGTPNYTSYAPQFTKPTEQEGRVFYDAATHSLGVMSDIPGVTLNVGLEQHIRVINKTGSTITNGKAVHTTGMDPTTNLPLVEYALADQFSTSSVGGITTHDILDGAEGWVTTFGTVSDINTDALTAGERVYLSSTVPGGFTTTPPDIVTAVGRCFIADASAGKMFVSIFSNIALPTAIGFLQGLTDPSRDLTATAIDLVGYTNAGSVHMTPTIATGVIKIGSDGIYRASVTADITFTSNNQTREIYIDVYSKTNSASIYKYTIPIPKDTTQTGVSFNIPFSAVVNEEVVLMVSGGQNITVSLNSMSFDSTSIHVR